MMDAPSSRVSSVVSMLGDLIAFWASFLILGEARAAGAFGMSPFYKVLGSLCIDLCFGTKAESLQRDNCLCLKCMKSI